MKLVPNMTGTEMTDADERIAWKVRTGASAPEMMMTEAHVKEVEPTTTVEEEPTDVQMMIAVGGTMLVMGVTPAEEMRGVSKEVIEVMIFEVIEVIEVTEVTEVMVV